MRRLFQPHHLDDNVHLQYPQWPALERGLSEYVERVKEYYQSQVRIVPAQHFLVRLLTSLPIPTSLEPQIFFDRVADVAYRVAAGVSIVTPINTAGIRTHGVFYGHDVAEVIAAVNEDVNVSAAVADWRNLEAVKVHRHPLTDLDIPLPTGVIKSDPRGLAVIVINIPLLALQYKCWWENQLTKSSGEPPLTMEHFIAMVVLPSILKRQLNLAIGNRLIARFFDQPQTTPTKSHPFAVPDYSSRLDAVLNELLATVCIRKLTFDKILNSIPQVGEHTFNELIAIPPGPVTDRIAWVWAIVQVPVLRFLVQVNRLVESNLNQTYLREIRQGLLEYTTSRRLEHLVPQPYCDQLLDEIDLGIRPYL